MATYRLVMNAFPNAATTASGFEAAGDSCGQSSNGDDEQRIDPKDESNYDDDYADESEHECRDRWDCLLAPAKSVECREDWQCLLAQVIFA